MIRYLILSGVGFGLFLMLVVAVCAAAVVIALLRIRTRRIKPDPRANPWSRNTAHGCAPTPQ